MALSPNPPTWCPQTTVSSANDTDSSPPLSVTGHRTRCLMVHPLRFLLALASMYLPTRLLVYLLWKGSSLLLITANFKLTAPPSIAIFPSTGILVIVVFPMAQHLTSQNFASNTTKTLPRTAPQTLGRLLPPIAHTRKHFILRRSLLPSTTQLPTSFVEKSFLLLASPSNEFLSKVVFSTANQFILPFPATPSPLHQKSGAQRYLTPTFPTS